MKTKKLKTFTIENQIFKTCKYYIKKTKKKKICDFECNKTVCPFYNPF
jgi:hypothetical protein